VTRTTRRLLIGLIVGILVVAAMSLYADVGELGERLASFSWLAFVAALGLALLNYGIRFIRWQLYLKRRNLPVRLPLSSMVFLSGFALSVTPGKVGELLKSYLLRETRGFPVSATASIVVAERVTDLAALLVLGGVGVYLYGYAQATVLAGLGVVLLGLIVLSWQRLAHGIIGVVTRPQKLRRFRDRLLVFYDGLADLVRPAPLTWATTLACVAWLAECIGFAIIVSGFVGAHIDVGLATLIYASTTIAGALSFLPGGLIVTEATMTLFLVKASSGLDEAAAAAATILTRLATLWFAVLLGLLALALLRWAAPSTRRALTRDENADILPQ
jgi:uncharacterized protein (TIRG00374 family)